MHRQQGRHQDRKTKKNGNKEGDIDLKIVERQRREGVSNRESDSYIDSENNSNRIRD